MVFAADDEHVAVIARLKSDVVITGIDRIPEQDVGRYLTVDPRPEGYLGRPEGTLLLSLMYNGGRPGAARQEQWKLFRLLGADGVVIPADTSSGEPVQLGGEQTTPPAWWPGAGAADSSESDSLGDES